MPLQTEIQSYIDHNLLTEQEALALTLIQIRALSTPFARAFIEQGLEMFVDQEEMSQSGGDTITVIDGAVTRTIGPEPVRQFVRGRNFLQFLLTPDEDEDEDQLWHTLCSIQQCIDEDVLTLKQALSLPINKVAQLGNTIIRGLITHGTRPLNLLSHKEVYGIILLTTMKSLPQRAVYSFILGALFSLFTDKSLIGLIKIAMLVLVGYSLVHDMAPVLQGRLTLDQALELQDTSVCSILAEIELWIGKGLYTREQVLALRLEQLEYLVHFSEFIANGTLTFDHMIELTENQAAGLRQMQHIAAASDIDVLGLIGPWEMIYSYDLSTRERRAEAADRVRQLITSGHMTLDQIMTVPHLAGDFDNRINALIMAARITIQQAQTLTEVQKQKLQNDGVYDLIFNGTLTLEQVLELTLGQCYQLDNPNIRAQVIAGTLAIHDIVAAEIAVRTPNAIQNINNGQSTHTKSVHRTASESATRLVTRYGGQLNALKTHWLLKEISAWANALSGTLINTAAKHCLATLPEIYDFTDPASSVTIRQLIVLAWLAIHDDKLRQGSLADAKTLFCEGLYEVQRGYNIDDSGVDNDSPTHVKICTGGSFNKLMEKLAGIHPDVAIEFITPTTAALKLRALVKTEVLLYLSTQTSPTTLNDFKQFNQLIKKIETDGVEVIWDRIKTKIADLMFSEFSSLYTTKSDPEFVDMINAGKYVNLSDLSIFQKDIGESAGYRAFVKKTLSNSNFFSRTASEYLIENRHANPVLQNEYDKMYGLIPIHT